ncbi:adhesion G-protein coupled receptor F3 [Scomber scombrus]|uniref:Adhesion G-protein coupled receptor F3 n=1 Tax=Scomber scombrus TaxID=13677 RepID=A0AAV1PD36_SCOSC|nr:adhesion G-protein coupled receptor F1 [Scomber scombrus]
MDSRVFLSLIGVVYIYCQVFASSADVETSRKIYFGEMMVESNVTLYAHAIESALNNTALKVNFQGNSHDVEVLLSKVISECVIIGDKSTCNCTENYYWSNEVCTIKNCCSGSVCTANLSDIRQLCVPKHKVQINGSVILSKSSWDATKATTLTSELQKLNAFESVNISESSDPVKFEAVVNVEVLTSKLQEIVTTLEKALEAVIWVDTVGMVTIESPDTKVPYETSQELKCLLDEKSDSAGWNLTRQGERLEINSGTVAKVSQSCTTAENKSCVNITIQEVTGLWEGTYECGFTNGSVRHTAKAQLKVSLLPDEISLELDPLVADCTKMKSPGDVKVQVTATIRQSKEKYTVWWSYMGKGKNVLKTTDGKENPVYSFTAPISCEETTKTQYLNVTFENSVNQTKSARVDISVVYKGVSVCEEESLVPGVIWPNTPFGHTVFNRKCEPGKVGFKSRTCDGPKWQDVFHYCINEELNKISDAASQFQMGQGATSQVALSIFEGLKNQSTSNSDDPGSNTAEIAASISILSVMAISSKDIDIDERVLPDFVNASSNMLNKSWEGVNETVLQKLSSDYLVSMEDLVKNIKINQSSDLNSPNVELKFCLNACPEPVFDIGVNLTNGTGRIRTVAVKGLTNKLKDMANKNSTNLLLSVTKENNSDSDLQISLSFPTMEGKEPSCVFWNTTTNEWSDNGCIVKSTDENYTLCQCNHLTAFSILMGKDAPDDPVLTMITNVGLGVSICSLLIFLIVESLVWSAVVKTNLSHFRHTAMVNIAVFLLLANCSFLVTALVEEKEPWCLIITACKHLFYLAMFCWMLCLSVMLVHQLIFVFSPLRKRVFMFLSSIIGYVCPLLIVGSSYVYYKYTKDDYHDKKTCWLVFKGLLEGSLHAFVLPVGTIILTNLFSMVVVILTLLKSSVPDGSKTDDKETAKSILKVVIFLTPVFGVTWVIGFCLQMLDQKSPLYNIASYSFTIINSFQGFFILIMGCIAEKKVRDEVLKLLTEKSKGHMQSIKKSTSTTYTKDK